MQVSNFFSTVASTINEPLKERSPLTLIAGTALTLFAIKKIGEYTHSRWNESGRERVSRLIKTIPQVKTAYCRELHNQQVAFSESTIKKWEKFGDAIREIPEKGYTDTQLLDLIKHYSEIVKKETEGTIFSGTIYAKTGISNVPDIIARLTGDDEYESLGNRLRKLFSIAYEQSCLWNSLHSKEFGIGNFIDFQVVQMVAQLFSENAQDVMGFVTSGGTESLMLAMRSYRNWGIKENGNEPGEGVIVAFRSAHAAVQKAADCYHLKVEYVNELQEIPKAFKKHGKNVICLIGSTPSYPTGKTDSICEMGVMALKHGCGFHVDACLGGFVINFLQQDHLLDLPGVTSLSVDTHKNGWAPKGSSVLITKRIKGENLAYHSIYTVANWDGGVYGTPKDAGSQSCSHSLNTLLAMLAIGKNGYRKMAHKIHELAVELEKTVNKFDGKLLLLEKAEVNVVAFKVDPLMKLPYGATYAFAHEMAKRGFVLNTLKNDAVHCCVTGRFLGEKDLIPKFENAVEESLQALVTMHEEGQPFPGDAGLYCALESAMQPNVQSLGPAKFLEQYFLGQQGVDDAIRMHFLALLNPYIARPLE